MLDWLIGDAIWETIIKVAVIAAIALIVIAAIRSPHARPILIAILCVAWLGAGAYAGYTYYAYVNTTSEVNGSIDRKDPYEDFNIFDIDLKDNVVWYEADNGYEFEQIYNTAIKFNGTENDYTLLVNDTPCDETKATNGRLEGTLIKQFRDIDGEITDTFTFKINFSFESSKITVALTVNATAENIGIIREYININGFNLRIIDSVY